MKKTISLCICLFFLSACGDKAIVNVYDKNILKTPLPCLKLTVFPKNEMIQKTMEGLYTFDKSCPYHLDITHKSGIACNSTQNVQTKCINGFPSSYLNMEVRKGLSLKYSYYIDLMSDVTEEDVKKGFERLNDDLVLAG
ncbi:hypothetical protein YH65_07890 [Sulfurovum lithotrophicum]|uniref:Lipoprotein n=1 Tax=Sulfurovum lithotrophicum TaxID=206403 RepID=A0A7U4RQW6_9BACT|nr:hypothetical protein [Sulfurovum lithotrophicum]AKF25318.1 hypothetical protein YH65_07890 [Sulfurovum lithotrophicum]